jgi:flavodoxin I
MKKIVLLYWPKEGSVEIAAKKIYACFESSVIDIFDVDSFDTSHLSDYEMIIMGNSTVGAENWEDADADNKWNKFFREIKVHDLSNKKIALFGLGNQILYPAHFVDGLGILNDEVSKFNGKLIGKWSTEGYSYTDSEGIEDDMFFGLALDEDTESELTDERIGKWTNILKKEL